MADNNDPLGIAEDNDPLGILKKKEETLLDTSSTPAAKPTRSFGSLIESQEKSIEDSSFDLPTTQILEPGTTVVAPPVIPFSDLSTGGDPAYLGGEALKEHESSVIKNRQQKLREETFRRSMNIEGRRGIPLDKEDIPQTQKELEFLDNAAEHYEILITSKLEKHIPQDLMMKSALVEKEREIISSIKEGGMTREEVSKARAKLVEIELELIRSKNNKKLFEPITGDTVDQDKASFEAIEYEGVVQNLVDNKYSDIENAYQASEEALHLFEYYEEEMDKRAGGYQHVSYMDLTSKGLQMELDKMPEEEIEKAILLKGKWVNAKANVEAIARAIMLNEDPSQIERGFGGAAGFHESVGKGFKEAVGAPESVTRTEGDFATRFVQVVRDAGKDNILTQAQVDNTEKSFTEKLGYGIGASIPIMTEIAITTAITTGTGSIPVVASNVIKVKNLFGVTKFGKLMANTVEQGVKGYISFAPTEETGATGAGEGVAQGVMDTLLPEKLIGGKYGKLLNYAIRVVGGATGQSIQEVSGQYINALNENGYDSQAAFNEAFGRNAEERWETLTLIGSTSLLFSGTFNAIRLVMTRDSLQSEIDSGNVPRQDVEAVKEVVKAMDDKINSERETSTPVAKPTVEEVVAKEKKDPKVNFEEVKEVEESSKEERKEIKEEISLKTDEKLKKGEYAFIEEPTKIKGESVYEFKDDKGKGYIIKKNDKEWYISSDKEGELRGEIKFTSVKEAIRELKTGEYYDSENARRLSSKESEGKKPIETKPIEKPSTKETETGRDTRKEVKSETEAESTRGVVEPSKKQRESEVKDKASLIESLKELKNEPTENLYKKAKELGIDKETEVSALMSKKAKEFEKHKKESLKDLKRGVFQKESTQEGATKEYAEFISTKLKKVFPNIGVEYSEDIKGAATIRDGKIIINPKKMGVDTHLHEVSEVWTQLVKKNNPYLYKAGISLAKKDLKLMSEMKKNRPDIKSDDDIAHELLNEAIGIKASKNVKMKSWAKKFWDSIKKFFGMENIHWRDLPTMKFDEFVKSASKDILSEKALSTVTESQLDALINGNLSNSDRITVDSSLLTSPKTSVISRGIKEFLFKERNLPNHVADGILRHKSEINFMLNNSAKNKRAFDKSFSKHISKEGLSRESVSEIYKGINSFLRGDATINTLDVSDDVKQDISSFKSDIKRLSVLIGKLGLPKDVKAVINENLGAYLHTSYEIHKSRPKNATEWIEKMHSIDEKFGTDVVDKAYREMESQVEELANDVDSISIRKDGERYYVRGKRTETTSKEEVDENTGEVVKEGEFTDRLTNEVEIDKGTLKLLLDDIKSKFNKDVDINKSLKVNNEILLNGGGVSFIRMLGRRGVEFNIPESAKIIINDMLQSNISEGEFLGFSSMNKKDVSILKNKKDLPRWYKDLLGEIKDPSINYMQSTAKMINLIKYTDMLNEVKRQTENTLLFKNKEDAPIGAERISAEGNAKWKPLDGYYAHPEFKKSLMGFENETILDIRKAFGDKADVPFIRNIFDYTYTAWNTLNAMTKMNLTKYSIQGNVRNHFGAPLMGMRMGVSPIRWVVSYTKYWKGQSELGSKEFKANSDKMRMLNLITSSVGFNTYKKSAKEAMKNSKKFTALMAEVESGRRDAIVGFRILGKGVRIQRGFTEFMDKFYQAPDASVKMAAWDLTIENLKKIYPKSTNKELYVENDNGIMKIEQMAADKVLDQLPTYDRMSRASMALSKNPIIGAFSSFSTEMYRNNANQLRSAYNFIKEGKKTGNKEMVSQGRREIGSLVAMSLLVPTLSLLSMAKAGINKDEAEELKSIRAEWAKNSWMIYWDLGSDKISEIDLTYSDPQSVITKSISPFFNSDDDMIDKLTESMSEFSEPFLGKEVLAGKMISLIKNENDWRMPIYGEEETSVERLKKQLKEIGPAYTPAAINQTTNAWDVYFEENESAEWGDNSDFETVIWSLATGVKVKKRDLRKLVGYKVRYYKKRYVEQGQLARGSGVYKNSSDPEQANIMRKEIYDEILLNVGAMRLVGTSNFDIEETLYNKGYGLPKSFIRQIMNGNLLDVPVEKKKNKSKNKKKDDSGFGSSKPSFKGGGSSFGKSKPTFN